MRTRGGFALLVVALFACGPVSANPRSACIETCDATAQACMATAHDKYDACKPAANKGCAGTPPAELFKCLTTALRACSSTHSAETEPCRTTFPTCYAACGPRPAGQFDFWCELDADSPASNINTRKDAFCAGTPGQSPEDQHAHCMKLFTPTDPAMGFSVGCEPLR